MNRLVSFFTQAIIIGMPLLYGSVGEMIIEKSGNLNLGIPGIMYVGGISGIVGGYFFETYGDTSNTFLCILIPFLCSIVGSVLMSLIYSFLTVTLRANQNVTGLVLTTFGIGIGSFIGGSLSSILGTGTTVSLNIIGSCFKKTLPFADKLGLFGKAFFSYGFMTYLAIIIALVAGYVLRKTRVGLNLKAVGESPATADAAGISVIKYKYGATCIGGAIAGLGGLYYVMEFIGGTWSNAGFGDRGWLAIALVIFALWKPDLGIIGSILFGGLYIVYMFIGGLPRSSQEIFKMLTYLVTILVLIAISVRKKRENQPPASLGVSYFREER